MAEPFHPLTKKLPTQYEEQPSKAEIEAWQFLGFDGEDRPVQQHNETGEIRRLELYTVMWKSAGTVAYVPGTRT